MSYAIIRNTKYKRENLKGIFRHNERRNKNYSNKNIDKEKSYLNYSLKDTQFTYEKEFDRIRKEYNLKGQIKVVSNIACEYIITSDKEFFESIGEEETKRYFDECYKFICNYKNLGEENIISGNSNDLWNLEIEGKEDFSFLYDGRYVSMHQVKSGKVNLKKNDKFAFIAELLQDEAQYGYFHINSTQEIPVDFIDFTLSSTRIPMEKFRVYDLTVFAIYRFK
mgnify:CR=1 FL=1